MFHFPPPPCDGHPPNYNTRSPVLGSWDVHGLLGGFLLPDPAPYMLTCWLVCELRLDHVMLLSQLTNTVPSSNSNNTSLAAAVSYDRQQLALGHLCSTEVKRKIYNMIEKCNEIYGYLV